MNSNDEHIGIALYSGGLYCLGCYFLSPFLHLSVLPSTSSPNHLHSFFLCFHSQVLMSTCFVLCIYTEVTKTDISL